MYTAKGNLGRHISPLSPLPITYEQPSPKISREEIYKSMAIPAMARAPIPANSLLAAPVYLATCGPVAVESGVLAASAGPAAHVPVAASGVLAASAGPAGLAEVAGAVAHVLG